MHGDVASFANNVVQEALVHAFPTSNAVDIKRALRLIDHRLRSMDLTKCNALIGLLTGAVRKIKTLASPHLHEVKQFLFKLDGVQHLCRSSLASTARTGMYFL